MSTTLPALGLGCLLGLTVGGQALATSTAATPMTTDSVHALGSTTVWARVHGDPDRLGQLLDEHAGIDYGRFRWLPLPGSEVGSLTAAGIEVQVRERPFELDLGGLRFDPLLDGSPDSRLLSAWQPTGDADWRLVQFHGPVRQAWLDALAATGVQPVQYVHPHAYIVWAEAQAMQRSAALPQLRWQGEFLPEYRLAPVFRRSQFGLIEVQILARHGLDEISVALERAGAQVLDRGRMDRHLDVIDARVAGQHLAEFAAIPGVYSVQPVASDGGTRSEMSAQINSDNVDGDGVALTGYLDYLDTLGLDGSGVIMACVDNGIQANHPDLANRLLACTGPSCGNGSQTDGHGTHVSGIMAGDASSGTLNSGGFLRGLGMAPAASLIDQRNNSIGAPWLLNLMRESVRNGATISNNSWGPAGSPQGYDGNTRQSDIGVRDADIEAEGDQPLTYVLAIMNGFGNTSTQGTPDEAKNLFTIGSAWAQINANTQDMRNNAISANSAHGPALDGRFIPHMIANSRFTDSPLGSSGYGMQGGTSQAAPHVAGATALFTQYYRNQFQAEPSPALIKAAFLAVTRDLEGNNDANNNPIGARPDRKQGWGRMQTTAVLAPTLPVIYVDQTHVFSDTGQNWQADYTAADPDQPMRLMLVWTDAPGHGLGGSTPAWNNDLDLRVEADGELYRGNVFAGGWSATGGSSDHRNNTEGVFLRADQHLGAISVNVLAADINSNALPNAGDDNSQDFALVCYNCIADNLGEQADLSVGLTDVPDPVAAGATLTYVVQAVNFGPDDSTAVEVTLTLPAEVEFVTSRTVPSGNEALWDCGHADGLVTCALSKTMAAASLAPSLEVDVLVAPVTLPGPIEASVEIDGELPDPVPGNNAATESTEVIAGEELIFANDFECRTGLPDC